VLTVHFLADCLYRHFTFRFCCPRLAICAIHGHWYMKTNDDVCKRHHDDSNRNFQCHVQESIYVSAHHALHTFLCAFMGEHPAFYLPEREFYKRGRFRSTLTPVDYVRIWYVWSADVWCISAFMACALALSFACPLLQWLSRIDTKGSGSTGSERNTETPALYQWRDVPIFTHLLISFWHLHLPILSYIIFSTTEIFLRYSLSCYLDRTQRVLWYSRITSTKFPSFCVTTFSTSLAKPTVFLPQSRVCSCYVRRRKLALPPLWLQKHTDLYALSPLVTWALAR